MARIHHTRVLRPTEDIYAFYDGRVAGYRYSEDANWVDDGALSLGIASYAIVEGAEAIVFDTHVSSEHARYPRSPCGPGGAGVHRRPEPLASRSRRRHRRLRRLRGDRVITHGGSAGAASNRRSNGATHEGPPPIDPLVLPNRVFSDRVRLTVGETEVELIHTNIHSDDATVIWLPAQRVLLCGDTMEDTITYVDEPESFDAHLANLEALRRLGPERILPNHGDPDVIARGGYSPGLIEATEAYIRALQRSRTDPTLLGASLRELIKTSLEAGFIHYYPPYEAVHRENLRAVLRSRIDWKGTRVE